ncbi:MULTISPECIES: hypothetical protein [Streptomyces]|uniref:Secreted protein n=2 Tax=Streptomyces TaxID=1883 RepID=A0A0W7X6G6_9ACTN|nr:MULTISPECIES: hypothetical protein [Streptomyces]KUF18282.1 hypothetical protein AT728_25335 [Streptomyces silvensis]MVO88174.1 hypothetical protein [Streptomyces typhae]
MNIAKAAAGVVGIAMALGAASPAVASHESPGGSPQLLDKNLSTEALKNPVKDFHLAETVGALADTVDRLETDRFTTTNVTGTTTMAGKAADIAGLS